MDKHHPQGIKERQVRSGSPALRGIRFRPPGANDPVGRTGARRRADYRRHFLLSELSAYGPPGSAARGDARSKRQRWAIAKPVRAGVPHGQGAHEGGGEILARFVGKVPGTEEGRIAEFFLGTNAADSGNLAREAEKHFKASIDGRNGPYASLGKLALAQIYGGEGKVQEGAQLIQSVIDHPTVLVSKDSATLALAEPAAASAVPRSLRLRCARFSPAVPPG